MKTNYSDHAAYWDWDAYDDTESYAFWLKMSRKYGKKILSPMCALGQTAAYMAQNGCEVVALDYTDEMVSEGVKRYGHIESLRFVCADVCDFSLQSQVFDFCFLSSSDLHLLPSIEDVGRALLCIGRHIRPGGGLGVEIRLPEPESFDSPARIFHPRVPRSDGPTVWKESESSYDAAAMVQQIVQTVFVEENGAIRSFEHRLDLRFYPESVLLDTFEQCGFSLFAKYSDTDFNACAEGPDGYYAEFVRS